ncbi:hypothetical protein Q8W71_22865 [Methylobacterium sp. NEAU 140]|uniref:hypothetical protein n=1 Tax=Methylobacterium sp. NEAU 140 TaxID=3064945 RepID=UPI0027341648|nr:hypothetical protein [Methylobacterium sp. NEAU 140]MDP4025479.1 hypothetical protein [Methylobacterium sp. NEAU 140]
MSSTDPDIPDIDDAEEAAIQAGIAEDPENPEWTAAEFQAARPMKDAIPDLYTGWMRDRADRSARPVSN